MLLVHHQYTCSSKYKYTVYLLLTTLPLHYSRAQLALASSSVAPQLVLVVQLGGAHDAGAGLVACATLALDEQTADGVMPAARLADVVVDGAWRGRGAGRALVCAAVRLAGQAGCCRIELTCAPRLVPFYRGCGLEEHAPEPPPPGGSAVAGQGAAAGATGAAGAAPSKEAEARCLWCAGQNAESEGGDKLLLCDGVSVGRGTEPDPTSTHSRAGCAHCFCAACIVHALGPKALQRVEQASPWLCFKCGSALKGGRWAVPQLGPSHGAPGRSGQRGTPRARRSHREPSHRLGCFE